MDTKNTEQLENITENSTETKKQLKPTSKKSNITKRKSNTTTKKSNTTKSKSATKSKSTTTKKTKALATTNESTISEHVEVLETVETTKPEVKAEEKKVFAQGMNFYKLFWVFVVGCVFGTYWEQVLLLITDGVWQTQQGMVYGPFNPIYGLGATLVIGILARKKRPWYLTVIYGALLCGAVEYLLGWLELTFTHSRSWDYSDEILNINGFITIPFCIVWGFLSLGLVKLFYPPVSYLVEKMPIKTGKIVSIICLVLLSLNMLLTAAVMLRHGERVKGNPPQTFVGEFLDKYYDDDFVRAVFPDKFNQEAQQE